MLSPFRWPLAATLLLLCAACAWPPAPGVAWFPFQWAGEKVDGKYYDKVAMCLPVQVQQLRGRFIAQFDLGSDATLLYEEALKNYFPSRQQLYALLDTTQRGTNDVGNHNYATRGLPLRLGALVIPHPRLLAGQGEAVPPDSLYTASEKLVGTVGADFLTNKVLVIDFPGRRMAVLDSVDAAWRVRTAFVPARIRHNRFHIPLTINKRTYWALFDTGSSLFALNTDPATWRELVGRPVATDSLHANSWGQPVTFYGAPMRAGAYLGRTRLPRATAWYTRNARLRAFNQLEHVDAVAGNAFFWHSTVVLDFRHSRFGVVKEGTR